MIQMRWLKSLSRKGKESIVVRNGPEWGDDYYTLQFRFSTGWESDGYGSNQVKWSDWQNVEVEEEKRPW